jgi:DNA-directed RNA polymerase subunit K/omega
MGSIDSTKNPMSRDQEDLDGQTFAPAVSKQSDWAKLPQRLRRRNLRSLEGLSQTAKNRYEAVLIASARARQLNAKKIALEERGLEDDAAELKRLKMTSNALTELLDGRIEVKRPEDAA